jgi:hypothetical protein
VTRTRKVLTASELCTCSKCLVILETAFAMLRLVTYIRSVNEMPWTKKKEYIMSNKNIIVDRR